MAQCQSVSAVRHIRSLIAKHVGLEQSDHELLQRFVTLQDEAAFAALLRRHGPMVLRVCRGVFSEWHGAEDAFQATFLVLARKAGSIRAHNGVGAWLRGVAYRVALKARLRTGKLPACDDGLAERPSDVDPMADMTLREAGAILNEELQRLPAKYREPVCLCYLEGQTRDQAARQLGCPAGTFNSRLERARELLRARLIRRGLSLSGALLTTLLSTSSVSAALSPALTTGTLDAALRFAAGNSPAGAVSAEAVTLAEGTLNTMTTIKLKLLTVFVLALPLLGIGAGTWVHQAAVAQAPASPEVKEPPAPRAPLLDRYRDPLPNSALARMGTLRGRHAGIVYVACLPDGKSAVTASKDGSLRLWSIETGKEIRRFRLPENQNDRRKLLDKDPQAKVVMAMMAAAGPMLGNLSTALLSADGTVLAAAPLQGDVHLWDVATGKELPSMKGEKDTMVSGLAFSPDGKTLAVWRSSGFVHLHDAATGKETGKLGEKRAEAKLNGIGILTGQGSLAFSPDGKTLLIEEKSIENQEPVHTAKVWDLKSGKELRKLKLPDSVFGAMVIARDTKTLAWFDFMDESIVLWDVAKDKVRDRLKLGPDPSLNLVSLTFSPDGKTLAVTSGRSPIRLMDVASGKEVATLGVDRQAPDGTGVRIVVAGLSSANPVAFSADGKILVSGGEGSTLRVWDVATTKERIPADGHQGGLSSLALSPDGKVLTTRGDDDTVRRWDVVTGRQLEQFQLKAGAGAGAFSPDGKVLAFATPDDRVHLWDVAADKELRKLAARVGAVDLAFTADGKVLATMTSAHVIQLWDVATGKEVRSMKTDAQDDGQPAVSLPFGRHHAPGLVFSPDGRTLASAENKGTVRVNIGAGALGRGDDASIHVWNVATGKLIRKLDGPTAGIATLAFSPDGRTLAVANRDNTLTLWEVATGKRRAEIKDADLPAVSALAFALDGKSLGLGCGDRSVRFLDVASAKAIGRLTGHDGPVSVLAFAPGGGSLISGSGDTTALVWSLAGLKKPEHAPSAELTEKESDRLWADLRSDDAARAWKAVDALGRSKQGATLLGKRLRPVPAVDADRLKELVAGLKSDRFAERKKATDDLEKLGDLAVPALQKVLDDQPPLDVRTRVEHVLENILVRQVLSAEQLQGLRAIEALERAGTPEARQVLEAVAKGAAGARLTWEAQASLRRLRASQP
jgi:RNA polymerase sigma factor (sigma-70 family)